MKRQYKYLIAILTILIVAIGGYSLIKSPKVKTVAKTPFGITQSASFFYPSVTSTTDINDTVKLTPAFYNDITVVVGNTIKWDDIDRRIKKASIENIKIIKEPKNGGYSLFKPTNDPTKPFNNDPVKYNITNTRRYDITIIPENINAKFVPDSIGELGGIVHLYYYSNSFKPIIKTNTQALDFVTAMKELGIDNNDLNARIAFDIQLTNKKDQTFIKHFQFDLPVSDINNNTTYAESKMYDADKNMFSKK